MAKVSVKNTEKKQKSQRKNYELNGFTKYILRYLLISGALIALIITLLAISLSYSLQSLENLDKIKDKVVVSYKVGSDIKMILPSFYFAIETMNYTGYTLKYNNATDETFKALYGLGNASKTFIDEFSNDPDFKDETVFDILNGNVCKYATEKYWKDCGTYTNGNSFGLLGLFTKYEIVSQTVYQYFASPDKSFSYIKQLLVPYGIAIANLHFTIYDVNDYLSTYLVEVFNQRAEKEQAKIFSLFVVSLCAVMISLVVLRGLVLSKLHMMDLAVKKIVNLFPPRMIADNKVISFYLIREMKHELGNLKTFI